MDNFDFFGPNLLKNWFSVRNWENQCGNKNQHPWDTMYANFETKQTTLTFSAQLCPKMGFWGRNFKNLILDSESASHVYKYLVKMNSSEFFGLNLGNSSNYVRHFGSNNVEGVAESWAEAEMSWREVDGGRRRLKWAGWRWMELGGGGCTV